jgi:hypothetical protein
LFRQGPFNVFFQFSSFFPISSATLRGAVRLTRKRRELAAREFAARTSSLNAGGTNSPLAKSRRKNKLLNPGRLKLADREEAPRK